MPATRSGRSTRSREIVARAHEVGALTYVDAVAYAPHGPIDVRALDTDFLVCRAYKWFGPHLGRAVRQGRGLRPLPAFKVRPAHDRFETGTAAFESIAGHARGDRLPARRRARVRRRRGAPGAADASERRRELVAGDDRDRRLRARAGRAGSSTGSGRSRGVTIHGIVDPSPVRRERVPTVSVSIDGVAPRAAAEALGRDGHLRVGRRLLRDRAHRAARQGRGRRRAAPRASSTTTPPTRSTARSRPLERIAAGREPTRRRSIRRRLARRSTRPSCAGSSGCGSATRSPRTAATSTA